MAYEKTNWVNNNEPPISAANLQNVEDGIEHNDIRLNNLDNIMSLTPNSWVANQEYAIHDIVVYNGMLYENITGNNSDTTPDSDVNNWSETKLLAQNSDGLVKINSQIVDNQYILATTTTQTANFEKITLNSVVSQEGNFTLSDGNIIIPSGISLIRVSGGVMGDTANKINRYLWGQIKHNSTVVSSNMSPVNGDDYIGCSMPPTVVEVQEGDTISLTASNTCACTNRVGRQNTWVLVEKIK